MARPRRANGANAQYNIIGWAGFYVTGFDASGSGGTVYGHFTRRITVGIQVSTGSTTPDYGVRHVERRQQRVPVRQRRRIESFRWRGAEQRRHIFSLDTRTDS